MVGCPVGERPGEGWGGGRGGGPRVGERERAAAAVESGAQGPWLAVVSSNVESLFLSVTPAAPCLCRRPHGGGAGREPSGIRGCWGEAAAGMGVLAPVMGVPLGRGESGCVGPGRHVLPCGRAPSSRPRCRSCSVKPGPVLSASVSRSVRWGLCIWDRGAGTREAPFQIAGSFPCLLVVAAPVLPHRGPSGLSK